MKSRCKSLERRDKLAFARSWVDSCRRWVVVGKRRLEAARRIVGGYIVVRTYRAHLVWLCNSRMRLGDRLLGCVLSVLCCRRLCWLEVAWCEAC
jgi:hypothetical protein